MLDALSCSFKNIHSCTSLTAHLLKTGGIEKLLKNANKQNINSIGKYALKKFIYNWLIITPKNLETVMLLAEKIEQNKKDAKDEKTTNNNDKKLQFKL